jgi:hypothetical protein
MLLPGTIVEHQLMLHFLSVLTMDGRPVRAGVTGEALRTCGHSEPYFASTSLNIGQSEFTVKVAVLPQ